MENIAACLERLLVQDWTDFTLLVLNDGSDDGTDQAVATVAVRDPRVELLHGSPIEPGWAGKVWACRQLGDEALRRGADWLLFLDADTRAQPGLVGAAVTLARTTRAGMVSTFPYQTTGSFWEETALPMLHFLIITFLPVRRGIESPLPQLVARLRAVRVVLSRRLSCDRRPREHPEIVPRRPPACSACQGIGTVCAPVRRISLDLMSHV